MADSPMRAHLELVLILVALLASAAIPCAVCGWATDGDRRQLELELPALDLGDEICAACRARSGGSHG